MVSHIEQLRSQIDEAGRLIAPLWPLSMSVAMNPLFGLVDLTFDDAVTEAARWLPLGVPVALRTGVKGELETRQRASSIACQTRAWIDDSEVDHDIARWCLRATTGGIGMRSEEGLVASWRRLYNADRTTRRLLGKEARAIIAKLPSDYDTLLAELVERSGVAATDMVRLFRALLARLPGWAGHARWQELNPAIAALYPSLTLTDLVVMQLLYRTTTLPKSHWICEQDGARSDHHVYWFGGGTANPSSESGYRLSGELVDAELAYRDLMLTQVSSPESSPPSSPTAAQFIFCMDPRSETIRRSLETFSGYETYGVAGFFGVPLRLMADDGTALRDLGPPLTDPLLGLQIDPVAVGVEEVSWSVGDAAKAVKEAGAAPYLGAEVGGIFAGFDALRRTLGSFITWPKMPGLLLDHDPSFGFSVLEDLVRSEIENMEAAKLEEIANSLSSMLVTLGLKQRLAPIVVLVGHRAVSANNAYAASLQCGACGGSLGTVNAFVAAALLNTVQVRSRLGAQGFEIPESTHFFAAEHNTTAEIVKLVAFGERDQFEISGIRDVIGNFDRCSKELGSNARSRRSQDWSEVRPEMGLIHNAALIIGPRSLTCDVDLGGRVFLHSYSSADDDDAGSLLSAVFAGPLVVAHWINMAYLFSSIEPKVFGAGDKTLHNVVGRFGVFEGKGWDLKIGLPEQSVADADGRRHEPLRLLVMVDASSDVVDHALGRNETVRMLVDGGWVRMLSRSTTDDWVERSMLGEWVTVGDRH